MAELVMKRLTLAGMNAEKNAILKKLAFFGAVELKDASPLLEEFDWFKATPDTADTYRLRSDLERVSGAIAALTPYATKRGLLTAKPNITGAEMDAAMAASVGVLAGAEQVLAIVKKRDAMPAEIAKLDGQAASLTPWLPLDIPLSTTGTATVDVMVGFFPSIVDISTLPARIEDLPCYVEIVCADTGGSCALVLMYKGEADSCMEALREFSFSRLSFRDSKETPAREKARIEAQIAGLHSQYEAYTEELRAEVGRLPELQRLYDTLSGRIAMAEAAQMLLRADSVFYLTGYVPEALSEKLYTELAASFTVAVEYEDVTPEEDPPVALKNGKLVQPYEMVTELYSLPAYGRYDPNAVMAPFFFVYFGLMFADIGYGLLMIAIGYIMLKKTNPQGFAKSLYTLFIHGGLSTAIVGAIFGSFFGDAISIFSSTFLGRTFALPALFNPIDEPITMLIICCGLGAFQLLVGMGVKAYIMIKDGDALGALYDIGFWYVVFAGLGFVGMGLPWGKYVLGAGALGLVLTHGRDKKNIIARLFSGVLHLYSITSYLGDVLSYSRLMALGIASAVIASVFNTMGALLGNSVVGIIVFILVFIAGHALNFALNVLGSYVHTSRLQYVEFFGKFYEDGGRPFNPLKVKTKYYHLTTNEEEN
ncbi:MAG TPA: V-type ATP synthase subunit I [Terriglobales bacterium]|nr:V-type ATP synthase subunit I [Terriglobales bacterium]